MSYYFLSVSTLLSVVMDGEVRIKMKIGIFIHVSPELMILHSDKFTFLTNIHNSVQKNVFIKNLRLFIVTHNWQASRFKRMIHRVWLRLPLLNTGFWLVRTDHVTWILASDWLQDRFSLLVTDLSLSAAAQTITFNCHWPIRGQYSGHGVCLNQSEASMQD